MNTLNCHAPLHSHPTGYRAIDTTGEHNHCLTTAANRHTFSAGNILSINISAFIAHFYLDDFIRVLHLGSIFFPHLTKNTTCYLLRNFRRSQRERFIRPSGFDFERTTLRQCVLQHSHRSGTNGRHVLCYF